MTTKKALLLLVVLLALGLVLDLAFRDNFGTKLKPVFDPWDTDVYADEGGWILRGEIPYTQAFSEYPQVAMLLFAVPHVILRLVDPGGRGPLDYYAVFAVLMVVFLWLSILILYELLDRKRAAFLLLLPASLYFTLNRYDILPCFLGLLALFLLARGRFTLSAVVLAVAVLTKWYAALWLPIWLAYYYTRFGKISWSMLAAFGLTSLAIVLPTLLTGGLDALLVPYKFQWEAEMNHESLMYLVAVSSDQFLHVALPDLPLRLIFFVCQFAAAGLCLTSRVPALDRVVRWSALSVILFVLFSKVNSPQWVLWINPLLILCAKKPADWVAVVAFDLITYLHFPLAFHALDRSSALFLAVITLKTVILIAVSAGLLRELLPDNRVLALARQRFAPARAA